MDTVRELGVDLNAPASESVATLSTLSLSQLLSLRDELFTEATSLGLTSDGDELVSRRDSKKKPLHVKLTEDISSLLLCLKNESVVPRSLLKNGKRSKEYLDASHVSTNSSVSVFTNSQIPPSFNDELQTHTPVSQHHTLCDSVRSSVIMKDINALKDEVKNLKKDVSTLLRLRTAVPHVPSTCHIRIVLSYSTPLSVSLLETDGVSLLLGCPALSVVKINASTLKVKIPKECLHTALLSSSSNSHHVTIWRKSHLYPLNRPRGSNTTQTGVTAQCAPIKIVTWNCRGLHNSIPYIQLLISNDVDVIILQEHWLWPFEHNHLQSISNHYSFTAVYDSRLNSSSDLHRGCGGVAILWKKNLNAAPFHHLQSDRLCAIKIPLPNSTILSIFGVYMPSADQTQETYRSYLDVLSSSLSELPPDSPLLIAGDLNCHLGHLGGPRSTDTPNSRGHLWKELIDRHSFFVPSLCDLASGPVYTYQSGSFTTTVDYVVGNHPISSILTSCDTLEEHPLNTSDHLPIVTCLDVGALTHSLPPPSAVANLCWERSSSDGSALLYMHHALMNW